MRQVTRAQYNENLHDWYEALGDEELKVVSYLDDPSTISLTVVYNRMRQVALWLTLKSLESGDRELDDLISDYKEDVLLLITLRDVPIDFIQNILYLQEMVVRYHELTRGLHNGYLREYLYSVKQTYGYEDYKNMDKDYLMHTIPGADDEYYATQAIEYLDYCTYILFYTDVTLNRREKIIADALQIMSNLEAVNYDMFFSE